MRQAIAVALVLVLALGGVAIAQGRPLDVARDDHRTARRLLYSSAKDDAERLKQLREVVRLLEGAEKIATTAAAEPRSGDEARILREAIAEDLATARRKLAPLEPTPAPTPTPTVIPSRSQAFHETVRRMSSSRSETVRRMSSSRSPKLIWQGSFREN